MQLSILKRYFYAYVKNLTTDKPVGSAQKDSEGVWFEGDLFASQKSALDCGI